jgi:transposase
MRNCVRGTRPSINSTARSVLLGRLGLVLHQRFGPKADPLPHSSLLAEVVTAKVVGGLPLYRREKIFAREGIDFLRQTLSGWIVRLAIPRASVMAALKRHLAQGSVLQIDETPVLDVPGRSNTTKS